MKKVIDFISNNILYLGTIFLLAFIPLYPKLPLLDIKNTWVYIRVEDFLVLFVLLAWVYLLIRKKVTLNTPITIPIMVFWIVGAIATIHGVILIFPNDANVFPNIAFLAYLRHIEYLSLFFVAFAGMRSKKFLIPVIVTLALTLVGVVFYGLGQKYAGFPAYLTMNEEFAKGIPITLSQLSRLPSTFAGQYDLAAYLVLVIPILVSIVFGVRNILGKLAILVICSFGFGLMLLTVSRVSFFVLLVSLFLLLFLYKKRFVLYALPILAILAFGLIAFSPALLARFGNTVKEVDVLVNGKTGAAVGEVKFVPIDYFKDKEIRQERVQNEDELVSAISGEDTSTASVSGVLPFEQLAYLGQVPLVTAANVSNGESLPQGTGYVNLSLAPVTKRVGNFFYEFPIEGATISAEVLIIHGDFIIKKASAYDLSFTTRFQGEWPHAILAFERNILIGSGYGSVSLAVDNNYLRMLGETGLLGLVAFFAIFIGVAIYIRKILPDVDSPLARSFVLGYAAGVVGLALNATLIDVFEASKIAYFLWMLTGITLGMLMLYKKRQVDLVKEFINVATSTYAIIIYLVILTLVIFAPMLGNYFTGDDFTWFRWVADCTLSNCSPMNTLLHYFTDSAGFFYRPGTKSFFYLMYQLFWLNQVVYHAVSLALHAISVILFFLLARRVFKNNLASAGAAFLFLILSGYTEAIFWISSIGFLFTSVFTLSAILLFIIWHKKKNPIYYALTILALSAGLLFQEMAMIAPLLIILYDISFGSISSLKKVIKNVFYLGLFVPDIFYLAIRYLSGSHWQGGDYSYNLLKLPFNIVGNLMGYLMIQITGPISLPAYEKLREVMRENIPLAVIFSVVIIALIVFIYRLVAARIEKDDRKILIFGIGFFVIALIPFLGLGNITSRYTYLASMGLVIIFVYVLQKIYIWIAENNTRPIAIASISVVVSAFALFQIIQVQQAFLDWRSAGQRAENFLIAIDDSYSDYWSTSAMELHFVNVPTKVGEAWVFPVGIEDALWFAFKNPNVKVYKDSEVTPDLQSRITKTFKVFKFNDDGTVIEIEPPKKPVVPQTTLQVAPLVPKINPKP